MEMLRILVAFASFKVRIPRTIAGAVSGGTGLRLLEVVSPVPRRNTTGSARRMSREVAGMVVVGFRKFGVQQLFSAPARSRS
jgi:hypothetical protein